MKRKIINILFCLIMVFGIVIVSCDNGDPPELKEKTIEKDNNFFKDHSQVIEDFFDSEIKIIIDNLFNSIVES